VAAGIDAVAVLLGTGQGDFDPEGVIAVPSRVASLALTDVNADAWPDVIAVGEDSRVDVVLNTPTGALDAEGIDFGAAAAGAATAAEVVTVFNDGVRPCGFRGARLGGADAAAFRTTIDDCSGTALGLLEACEIAVAFAPGTAGAKRGALVVSTDDPNGDLTAALVGTATGAGSGARARPGRGPRGRGPRRRRGRACRRPSVRPRRPPGAPTAPPRGCARGSPRSASGRSCGAACASGSAARSRAPRRSASPWAARRRARFGLRPRRGGGPLAAGRRTATATRAGAFTVAVPLRPRVREAARRAGRLDLRVTAVVADASGNRAPAVRRTVRLRSR
jgi:hypothetical protein